MRINLQVKILTLVSFVITLVLTGLMFLAISRQREVHQLAFKDKARVLAQALDAGIGTREELKDKNRLQSNIYKLIWLNPDIVEISISLPVPEGLKVVVSNNTNAIDKIADPENLEAYEKGLLLTKTISQQDGTRLLKVVTPVHVGGQIAGSYEMRLSLESEERAISQQQKQWVLTILISIFITIIFLFISLRVSIIAPIKEIEKGLKTIGAGNLGWRIVPKSKDEIGDLAEGLNKMAEELGQVYSSLEEKVQLRTQELQENIKELERFKRIAVGRELKMVELKEEIEKLKTRGQKKPKTAQEKRQL